MEPELGVAVSRCVAGVAVIIETAHGRGATDERGFLEGKVTPDPLAAGPECEDRAEWKRQVEVGGRLAVHLAEGGGDIPGTGVHPAPRSEERRVGKEGRT